MSIKNYKTVTKIHTKPELSKSKRENIFLLLPFVKFEDFFAEYKVVFCLRAVGKGAG